MLRAGGLVILPTETVYGLGANALDEAAAARIYAAKGRPSDNPLIVHIADFDEIYRIAAEVPPEAERLAARFWPGPLTIVLPKSDRIPRAVSGGLDTVAVRMPAHPVARAVIRAAGVPIAAPSANRSGRPSPTRIDHVRQEMDGRVDLMLDGGDCDVGVESSVVTLVTDPPRLLRPGGVPLEALREVLPGIVLDRAVTGRMDESDRASAPGMKYRHYAPRAPMTLYEGQRAAAEMARACRGALAEGERVGVLCFAGEEPLFPGAYVRVLGRGDAPDMQAHQLFDLLRDMDAVGVARILAHAPDRAGLGLAVYNRMLKAAGHQVIHTEE